LTEEDKDLFDKKQKFVHSVFDKILLTDQGKVFVHL